MVAAVRRGAPRREVARRFGVALATVQLWVARAGAAPRPRRLGRPPRRAAPAGQPLRAGAGGPRADHPPRAEGDQRPGRVRRPRPSARPWRPRGIAPLPSVRTIDRILDRARGPGRPPPGPPPRAAAGLVSARGRRPAAELDSFDIVEGLVIKGGPQVEVLNGISLHGGLVASWPMAARSPPRRSSSPWSSTGGRSACRATPSSTTTRSSRGRTSPPTWSAGSGGCAWAWGWCRCSSRRASRASRRPSRATTAAGRPRSGPGSRTSRWTGLQARSARYVAAPGRGPRRGSRRPRRGRPFPEGWQLDLQARPRGRIVYLRRTDAQGGVEVLGRRFEVDARGRIGWSGPRWTWTPAGSGSTPCGGASRPTAAAQRGGLPAASQAVQGVTGSCCHLPSNLVPTDRECWDLAHNPSGTCGIPRRDVAGDKSGGSEVGEIGLA